MIDIPEGTTLDIGKYTYGEPIIKSWYRPRHLHIGSFCSIGGNVTIYLSGNHELGNVSTFPFYEYFEGWKDPYKERISKEDVYIGNDVWIGDNVVILPGTYVESGAVLGAYSVARGHVYAYCVYAGNPAQVIKQRFRDDQINALMRIKWWDWSDEKIEQNIGLLINRDIQAFIDKHENFKEEA
jgi:acetyltransferase-like isoleucine patch superfamily enzyme